MNMRGRYFRLADPIPCEYRKELAESDCMVHRGDKPLSMSRPSYGNFHLKDDLDVEATWAGEKRPPNKGEWYLLGAEIEAYRAPNDLTAEYHIAVLVVTRTTTTIHREIIPTKPAKKA